MNVEHVPNWLPHDLKQELLHYLKTEQPYFKVCYKSGRFKKQCVTPCWTNCYTEGSYLKQLQPYQEMPQVYLKLKTLLEVKLQTKFNVCLVRLYKNGNDNIHWHTDARKFLGVNPIVASISLGDDRKFQMRKPTHLWPTKSNPWKSKLYEWKLKSGDLFVMKGDTQHQWWHRVPKEPKKSYRFNINFRYIKDTHDAQDGVDTYYKYCVFGDNETQDCKKFDDIWIKSSLCQFFSKTCHKITPCSNNYPMN